MNELVDFGEVRRGSFGYVLVRPVTPQLARELGTPDTSGAVIWTIHESSSAARAGMQPGDVIVAIDDTRVEDPSRLRPLALRRADRQQPDGRRHQSR